MKATIEEHPACFEIRFTPETPDETAQLIRLGINATKNLHRLDVTVPDSLHISGYMLIGKKKRVESSIVLRKIS